MTKLDKETGLCDKFSLKKNNNNFKLGKMRDNSAHT